MVLVVYHVSYLLKYKVYMTQKIWP